MTELAAMPLETASLFAAYRPIAGGYDEMFDATGQVREHWRYLIEAQAKMGGQELEKRRQEIRHLLRDNGVTYTLPAASLFERPRTWELDPVPLLLPSQEWTELERGLLQRAELFNLLLRDIYGAGEVFRKKLLPPELIYTHSGYLRPCTSVPVPGERSLHLYGADLVRLSNGAFCVVGDRAQATAGAGYALENRIVLSRVFPSLFRDAHVHRLAQFFRGLRQTLNHQSWRVSDDIRIVVMSAGPDHENYFEQAYLAKYLGYTLVQGADLTVRDGKVWLKTLDGLQSVDVIMRWVDGPLCDPLELQPDSSSGVAGLLQSMRMRNVAVVNSPAVGVLENRGLMQFLPYLCRHFLGEDLRLSSPLTYWCGLTQSRAYALSHMEDLVFRRTHMHAGENAWRPASMDAAQKAELRRQILAAPQHWLAQLPVNGSTAPVFANGVLEPRQIVLRTFVAADENAYQVMPGGLARTAAMSGERVAAGGSGGLSKDVWVLASEPTRYITLIPSSESSFIPPPGQGELPSRVAENLFWLGRYVERAEGLARLLRTVLLHWLDPQEYGSASNEDYCLSALLRTVTDLSDTHPGFTGEGAAARLAAPEMELLSICSESARTGSLAYDLNALLYAVRAVRDRISPDIWRVFNDIEECLQRLQNHHQNQDNYPYALFGDGMSDRLALSLDELNKLVLSFAAFSGLAVESMTHGQGWRFLVIGRRIERAYMIIQLLQAMLERALPEPYQGLALEALLNICDSAMTYRSRYRTQIRLEPVLDLLLQDETNPRAISYQLERLQYFIAQLPRASVFAYKSREERLVLEALSLVRLADPHQLMQAGEDSVRVSLVALLAKLKQLLPQLSDALSSAYFSHAEAPRQLVDLEGEPDT
jgi:uncharacterized circularly permuted ATP-grasp superfamily protein/uncharacterized alpha-E superfamily protein